MNLIKRIIDKSRRKPLLVKPVVSESINKCFSCKWCKQEWMNCMKCKHPKANKEKYGRGNYCYPDSYDNCDCGGFKYSR